MGVFARKDLSCVGHIAVHQLGLGERKLFGSQAALSGGVGGAHLLKKVGSKTRAGSACQPAFLRAFCSGFRPYSSSG